MKNLKPLEGVRILAITQYGAGPYSLSLLADLGAEIIKIEDPNSKGDISRFVIPYAENEDSLFFQTFNRNKKSITIDLKTAEGREVFEDLVKVSDAVFNNLRGDVPEKLRLKYEDLKHLNPRIVTCSLSGFGTTSSMAKEPAYDYLLQAMNGHMDLTGEPGGLPTKYGLSVIDFSSGMMAALGVMVGIFQAKMQGKGTDVDVSLFDTSISLLNYLAVWHLNKGYKPERTASSAHPTLVPSQLFETANGHIIIMCNKEKFYRILCENLERADLITDTRFANFDLRFKNKEALIAILSNIFKTAETAHWLDLLKGKVPIAPVNTIEEALKQDLVYERDMIVEVDSKNFGPIQMIGSPIKLSTHNPTYHEAPALGQDNYVVFEEILNYSPEKIKELMKIVVT